MNEPLTVDTQKLTAAQLAAGLKAQFDMLRNKTDGCTMAPDLNFEECCIEHDYNYRLNPDGISRTESDKRLRDCIASKNHRPVAWLYWLAARVFGRKHWIK